ncbi:MAG TPA: hypothetical protein VGY57_12620, partial [Vicinamibacterales bacterium]|nr:hypothetical protein [Vicinamibacterales bacterium]
TAADRRNDLLPSTALVMERLTDGPVPELLNPGTGTSRAWSVGTRVASAPIESGSRRHEFIGGIEVSGSAADVRAAFSGRVGEMLNGVPTRVWNFTTSTVPSTWSQRTLSLFGSDRIEVGPRMTVDAAIRFETLRADNSTGAQVVSWHDFMPKVGARIALTNLFSTAAFAYYGRYGHRLPLSDLAWGDPTAPSGTVSLWKTATPNHAPLPSEAGTLIARIGPGTGGDPAFSAVDPALARPHMDELVTGFEGKPNRWSMVRLYAMARRERNLIGAADVGVPESTYIASGIADHGVDQFGSTDQILPIYNRAPSTFGADRYLLTNPPDDEATFVGAELTFETQTEHLYLLMGATAGRSQGLAANRGFNALENDDGIVGEVFIDPNARTFAQGRMFTERGYTLKWSGAYRWTSGATFGLVARYEDGQHFARLVIVPGLNQGLEAVRGFRNGKTRFTFINTLDLRYRQPFTIGAHTVTATVDAFNVLNTALEMEEFTVSGPLSRSTTAVQPPRAIHFGIRIPF